MINDVVLAKRTGWLQKALQANSSANAFTTFEPFPNDPTTANGWTAFNLAANANWVPDTVRVLPYGEGATGNSFSMRLYGWTGFKASAAAVYMTWIPTLLAELSCTLCNISGPRTEPTVSPSVTEQFCDTISLTQGSLGNNGEICSTGPGTDLIAWARIGLAGAQYLSFDFQLGNSANLLGMNCLWVFA